jgi:hypothetical protein
MEWRKLKLVKKRDRLCMHGEATRTTSTSGEYERGNEPAMNHHLPNAAQRLWLMASIISYNHLLAELFGENDASRLLVEIQRRSKRYGNQY